MQKEPTKQANKAIVDAKQQDHIKQANGRIEVDKLKNEKQELLRKIDEQTAKIKNLEKQKALSCREKENLAKKVAHLDKDLKTLREELKQKTEIIKKMEAHQKSIEGSLQQMKKDRKEDREKDKKFQTNTEATMKLMLNKLEKLEMKPLQNRTSDLRANRK
ncbi:polyamine-modulated factor 1-binding protein 1-like [Mytilus edulis]|uniref:polyamine-modulated factor 1-binding protein 1-like n=1 Tax=Mytilus edulis TaxID=6550 RepID=UPI0039EFCEC8